MYVCVCNAVSDRQIRKEVNNGARSMRDLHQRLGVASTCGRCAPCAREHLMACVHEAERDRVDTPAGPQLVPAT